MNSTWPISAMLQGLEQPHDLEDVAERVAALTIDHLVRLLGAGWGPDELVRTIRRRAGTRAAGVVAGPLAEAMRGRGPSGRDHAPRDGGGSGADARPFDPTRPGWLDELPNAMDALGVLERLPALPDLGSVGSVGRPTRSHEEERVLVRIRALLAKAESTDFEEEADAFMAKAQQLMTRHCVDGALLGEGADQRSGSAVVARRIWLEDPYLRAKSVLLAEVAEANRCRAVVSTHLGFSTIVGFPADLDATELLFTSLLVQATRRLTILAHDTTRGRQARRPAYRRSFLLAYAERIGGRLREANNAATAAADDASGQRLLPVLAAREDQVETAVGNLFGTLGTVGYTVGDLAGWAAGTAAADGADLGVRRSLPGRDGT